MNQVNMEERINTLVSFYGDGEDRLSPTITQWGLLFSLPEDSPVTLLNFFTLCEGVAVEDILTGLSIMGKYGQTGYSSSQHGDGAAGFIRSVYGSLIGDETDWSVAAVGVFSSPDAVIRLFEDAEYQAVYIARKSSCEKQQVLICTPISEII